MRLDKFLSEKYPTYSRSVLVNFIKSERVQVNTKTETNPAKNVNETDDIKLNTPCETDFSKEKLPIIYEDENVVVVNKPTGVLTHSKGALSEEFTVAEFMKRYWSGVVLTNRTGIVHRLDRATSGVMIAAKDEMTMSFLQKQFSTRKVKKTYVAVIEGVPKEREAKIDLPLARNPKHPSQFRVDPNGKTAITVYKVLATNNQGESLVELKPETGRTHQLRIHMSYLGTPIKGDPVYGKPSDRMYLHAKSLEITTPGEQNERKVFGAPTPPEFTESFDV